MTDDQVAERIGQACPSHNYHNKKVLLIVPDGTRTAPLGMVFRLLYQQIGCVAKAFDVLIALGTHQPMNDDAILRRLEISADERNTTYRGVRIFNHEWNNPAALQFIGVIPAAEIDALSGGLFSMDVNVEVNKRVFEYDEIIIVGPVFPHEVVGFSGGNKYLFPGISGQEVLDMFHWLGALITNPSIIGSKYTPVRAVVDKSASLVPVERKCASLVVEGQNLAGLYIGTPEEAWEAASTLSDQIHIVYKLHPYKSVLSCAPAMYDELWVGGKCAYKLEPVVADGGELIIYAPHISEISVVHGALIREIGYHVRDYFLKQPGRFTRIPRGVLAHSTHVKGVGTFDGGVESPRITVTLATGIGEADCRAVNLGYRDHRTIDATEWQSREDEGFLHVPKAGETLFRLQDDPFKRSST